MLGLFAAALLALCAWVLTRSGAQTGELPEAPRPPGAAAPVSLSVALERTQRSPAADERAAEPSLAAAPRDPRPQTLVHGALLDSSRSPIPAGAGASVRCVDPSGRRRSSPARAEGDYRIAELGFGTYCVTARAAGYRTAELQLELLPNQPCIRRDFVLQKAVELRIRLVTPAGQDLLEVLEQSAAPMGARWLVAVATEAPPGARIDEVGGNPSEHFGLGQFRRSGPRTERSAPACFGCLSLDGDLPVYVSLLQHQVVLETKRVGCREDEVSFVVAPETLLANLATIRASVIDAATRLPIPGARLLPWCSDYSNAGVSTDASGCAILARREPGSFDLQVRARGYERFRVRVDALPGAITDLGTIALEQEVTLAGRILGGDGRARRTSLALGIVDPLDRSIRWLPGEEFESRASGSFDLRGLGRREYVIRTSDRDLLEAGEWEGIPWVSEDVLVDARGGSIRGLELRLFPATRHMLDPRN